MLQVLQVGMQVLIENTKEKIRKGGKFSQRWLGDPPYIIKRIVEKGLYELATSTGKVFKTKYNVGRLKVCF